MQINLNGQTYVIFWTAVTLEMACELSNVSVQREIIDHLNEHHQQLSLISTAHFLHDSL